MFSDPNDDDDENQFTLKETHWKTFRSSITLTVSRPPARWLETDPDALTSAVKSIFQPTWTNTQSDEDHQSIPTFSLHRSAGSLVFPNWILHKLSGLVVGIIIFPPLPSFGADHRNIIFS